MSAAFEFKMPLPGESMQDYLERVHFEQDDEGRWWCRRCGGLVRGREWLHGHYDSVHGFRGF